MATYHPATRTALSRPEAYALLAELAWGLDPSLPWAAVRLLCAMATHEGWGWNHNWGGSKARVGEPFTCLRTHEVVPNAVADRLIAAGEADEENHPHPGVLEGMRAVYFRTTKGAHSHPATRFAHYDTAERGCSRWLARLLCGGSYDTPATRAALAAGDPAQLAAALKAQRYYTASESSYASALARLLADPGVGPQTFGMSFAGA